MTVLAYIFSPNYFHRKKKTLQLSRTAGRVMRRGPSDGFSCKPFPPSPCEEGDTGQHPPPRVLTIVHLRGLGGHRGKLVHHVSALALWELRVRSTRGSLQDTDAGWESSGSWGCRDGSVLKCFCTSTRSQVQSPAVT